MGTITLYAFVGIAGFFLKTRNWKGLFVVLVAGISGLLVLIYFEDESERFVSNMFLFAVLFAGAMAALLCKLLLGTFSPKGNRELTWEQNDQFEFFKEMPNGKYLNNDIDDAVPNVPGDPSINTVWPNVQ